MARTKKEWSFCGKPLQRRPNPPRNERKMLKVPATTSETTHSAFLLVVIGVPAPAAAEFAQVFKNLGVEDG